MQGKNDQKIMKISLAFFTIGNLIWVGIPIAMAILWSLVDPNHPWSYPDVWPQKLSFEGWIRVWESTDLPKAVQTSYMIAPVVALITVICSLPTAYALGRMNFRGKKIAEYIVLMPIVIPSMTIALFFNATLLQFGFSQSFMGIVIGHSILAMPYTVRILTMSFASVPESMVHAARDLGAGNTRIFWDIFLPMIKTGLLASLIFAFIVSIEEFNISFVLGAPTYTTIPTVLYSFLGYSFIRSNAAIVSIILVIPNVILMYVIEQLLKGNYLGMSVGK